MKKRWGIWSSNKKDEMAILERHSRTVLIEGKLHSVFGPGAALRKWQQCQSERWGINYARGRGYTLPHPGTVYLGNTGTYTTGGFGYEITGISTLNAITWTPDTDQGEQPNA